MLDWTSPTKDKAFASMHDDMIIAFYYYLYLGLFLPAIQQTSTKQHAIVYLLQLYRCPDQIKLSKQQFMSETA